VQQQQGAGYGSVSFTSQFGTFDVSSLPELGAQQVAETPTAAPAPQYQPEPPPAPQAQAPEPASGAAGASGASEDSATIVAAIESLAGLHQRGILSDEEFATKKAELLGRL
jgi:hypothetical protein